MILLKLATFYHARDTAVMEGQSDSDKNRMTSTPSVGEVEHAYECILDHTYDPLDPDSAERHRVLTSAEERYFPNLAARAITVQIIDDEGESVFGVFHPK